MKVPVNNSIMYLCVATGTVEGMEDMLEQEDMWRSTQECQFNLKQLLHLQI